MMSKILMVVMLVAAVATIRAAAVEQGEKAPDFRAASTAGSELGLSDFSGSWLGLYFYPKSFTPGCTAQTCSLRDGFAALQTQGARILGVSLDKLETQRRFKAENNLPFDLLADTEGVVAKAYGALGFGGFMAKRMTFIIAPDGTVARVIDDVKTGSHDAQVGEALRALLAAPAP